MSEHNHIRPRCIRCEAVDRTDAIAASGSPVDDAAVVIGLALAHARPTYGGAASVPEAILTRLDVLADSGDPTSRLVRNWLHSKRTRRCRNAPDHVGLLPTTRPVSAEIISAAATEEGR